MVLGRVLFAIRVVFAKGRAQQITASNQADILNVVEDSLFYQEVTISAVFYQERDSWFQDRIYQVGCHPSRGLKPSRQGGLTWRQGHPTTIFGKYLFGIGFEV